MFTIYDEEQDRKIQVEEPDPSITYTYADYMKWKFIERLELFKGRIFRMAAPSSLHQIVIGNLYLKLGNFLKKKPCKVYLSPLDVRLPVSDLTNDHQIITVVQPDLIVLCDPSKMDERGCCGAPDLVVEVISPGNSQKDVRLKYELYEEAGVKEYWIIHPVKQSLMVYTRGNDGKFGVAKEHTLADRITSSLIPGFEIQYLSEIFEK